MSRFIARYPWPNPYARDKQLHFLSGSIITFIGSVLHYNTTACIATCCIIALMKEVYDYYSPNHICEVADWTATVAGGILGLIILRPLVMLLGLIS